MPARRKEVETVTLEDGFGLPVKELDQQFVPDTWGDVEQALSSMGADVIELKAVWTPVDKSTLVGTPFMIVSYDFYEGDYGPFVAVRALTANNERVVFVDGSTGVKAQLEHLFKTTGQKSGIRCMNGLRVSEYKYTDTDGSQKPAKTYYIA